MKRPALRTVLASLALACLSPIAGAMTPAEAVAQPGRLESDLARDARSKPERVLALLDLKPGDRVADVFGGSGYYSELMAGIVGAEGEVLLHNNAAYRQFIGTGLEARFKGRDPGRVVLHDREVADLDLGEGTLDAVVMIMSYHDLYFVDESWPPIDGSDFLGQIYRSLKPGGKFLVVDHYAEPGSGNSAAQELHRIDVGFAREDIASQGFQLVAESDALRNPEDDHSVMVFDPAVRGRTDRFVLLFRRPE